MTKVTIRTHDGIYKGFKCLGHAGFAESGDDIVCAAVSILVINTINSLEIISKDKLKVEEDENKGMIKADFIEELTHEGRVLMDAMVLGLKEVEKQYGNKYLRLDLKEV
ncbi:MAG: ribosomal-processing cysteine protease Prp [Lachnospiraceae bacterium]|nr:ribosomal-processing cysteine protease Prp [Lachnospiraceae bacterium]